MGYWILSTRFYRGLSSLVGGFGLVGDCKYYTATIVVVVVVVVVVIIVVAVVRKDVSGRRSFVYCIFWPHRRHFVVTFTHSFVASVRHTHIIIYCILTDLRTGLAVLQPSSRQVVGIGTTLIPYNIAIVFLENFLNRAKKQTNEQNNENDGKTKIRRIAEVIGTICSSVVVEDFRSFRVSSFVLYLL